MDDKVILRIDLLADIEKDQGAIRASSFIDDSLIKWMRKKFDIDLIEEMKKSDIPEKINELTDDIIKFIVETTQKYSEDEK